MSPDDVLLETAGQLRGAAAALRRVRRTFPSFIDEFQDTDPTQYAIFDALYPTPLEDKALVMIGDPKQAIYAFRGDVHAYLDARQLALDAKVL